MLSKCTNTVQNKSSIWWTKVAPSEKITYDKSETAYGKLIHLLPLIFKNMWKQGPKKDIAELYSPCQSLQDRGFRSFYNPSLLQNVKPRSKFTLPDLVWHLNRESREIPPTAQQTILADLLIWLKLGDTRTVLHQEWSRSPIARNTDRLRLVQIPFCWHTWINPKHADMHRTFGQLFY